MDDRSVARFDLASMRRGAVLVALSTMALALAVPSGQATTITVDMPPAAAPRPSVRGGAVAPVLPIVRMTGIIETGDAEKLRDVLSKLGLRADPKSDGPLTTIELSSMGGSLTADSRSASCSANTR